MHPLKITDANGNVEEKKYDANNNVIEEINKNGSKTLYAYDGLNNVIIVQNNEDRYVQYIYDKANNLTIKNINNKYAKNTYDEDGNLLSEENEYGYKSQYTYDEFGNKIEEVKPDKTTIKYTYDHLGNKLTENKNTFTYDRRNNIVTSTNKEGTVKNTYDAFNNKTSVTDTKGKKVSYIFNNDNKVSNMKYGGVEVTYTYTDNGLLDTVKKDNSLIAKYEYNNRNEVVQLNQNNTITNKTYDEMGRVLTQKSLKDGKSVLEASYSYDANDNVIKEIIDNQTNTYEFDAYDELTQSSKHVSGKKVDTTYKHDVFGNQIENSSSEGRKVFKYNDKNQIKSIETKKGTIKYRYDNNGNVSKKINENGIVDQYTYDDLNQLTKLVQGQYTYDYKYDAEKERITQIWTDTKDYHYDQWYDYSEPLDVVGDSEIEDTFKNLKQQAKKKKANKNTCTSVLKDTYDVTYYKKPKVTEYTVDRNKEYTQVLATNDTINVYGDTLLQSNNESIITAKNESVVAKVTSQDIKKINYSDYGQTEDLKSGNGYNSETLDQTGLIYLRARYYDPSVSRFVQIDNNYDGDKQSIASQNKYVYTMNNPYKYVDRNGNWWVWDAVCDFVDGVVKKVKKTAKKVEKVFVKYVVTPVVNKFNKVISNAKKIVNYVGNVVSGIAGNISNALSGGSIKVKPTFKKVDVVAKCPTEEIGDLKNDIFAVIDACLSWPDLIENTYKLFKNGFKMTGWLDFALNCIREGKVKGVKLSANGARKIVKGITDLGTGGRTKFKNIVNKVFKKSLNITRLGEIGKVIKWARIDVISFAIDVILNFTNPFRIGAIVIAQAAYKFMKKVGATAIKAILTPFMGPFAWLLGTVIEIGIDVIDFIFDLQKKLTDFTEWLIKQIWSTVELFIKAVLG